MDTCVSKQIMAECKEEIQGRFSEQKVWFNQSVFIVAWES